MNFALPLMFWFSGALAAAGLIALGIAVWSLSWPRTKGIVEVSFLDKEDARPQAWVEESADLTMRKNNAESHAFAYSYEDF